MAALVVLALGPLSTAMAEELVEPELAPAVTSSPSSASVVAGEGATFTASASGVPAPTVQWEVSTDSGSTWASDTTDGGNNTGMLTVATTAAMNGYVYRALFTNLLGTARSEAATLTVNTAPVVTSSPLSTSVVAGENATFSAAASGAPPPQVQWQISTNGGSQWEEISGATSDTLTFATAPAANGDQLRAVFKNSVGEVTSAVATLTVGAAPPVITENPLSTSVVVGENATFSAAASGTPPLTVQWQYSSDGGSHWINVPFSSATSDTLTFAAESWENGDPLRAVFKNPGGEVASAVATLTVVATPPAVTSNPLNTSVVAGENATFSAAASGVPPPQVQWQVSTNGGSKWEAISGATSDTLTFPTTVAENNHKFRLRAVFKNSVGEATSAEATLTIEAVAPVVMSSPTSVSVVGGEKAMFSAAASGVPPPQVQWLVSTNGGSKWEAISGATSDTLTFPTTIAENGHAFEVRAVFKNPGGEVASAVATLTVAAKPEPPKVTLNPASKRVMAGEAAIFTAEASGVPTPNVQWEVSTDFGSTWNDTTDSGIVTTPNPGRITDTLTVATAAAENGYEYRAGFTSRLGTATSAAATLIVESPPPPAQGSTSSASATGAGGASATGAGGARASFAWFPTSPHAGEQVSLVSSSTDATGAITAFAWDVAGNGPFTAGGPVMSTLFSAAGSHVVRLRVTDANGRSSVVAETIAVTAPREILMAPFPIVRIVGFDTSFGVQLSLLSAQAPVGARITLVCRGHGCPVKREVRVLASSRSKAKVGLLVFRRFERSLPAGIVLQIRIWKPGQIGKYTSFTIRRRKLPLRVDTCLDPGSSKPIACPSS
jgi:hypothetical protein